MTVENLVHIELVESVYINCKLHRIFASVVIDGFEHNVALGDPSNYQELFREFSEYGFTSVDGGERLVNGKFITGVSEGKVFTDIMTEGYDEVNPYSMDKQRKSLKKFVESKYFLEP